MGKVIGIDLGTTNSVVAVLENARPEVIANTEGGKTTPSVVFFDESAEIIVGELAKRQRITSPDRAIYSVKRFMGCRWDEAAPRMSGISYAVVPDAESMTCVQVGERLYRPEDISARVLEKMKATAEAYLGSEVFEAIITVPAHFNDGQRQATKLAGEKAGLKVLRIINEPTAAALAYGLNRREGRQRVAIFDFGGGTFDISILEIDGDIFEVKSTGGDTFLGGDNINQTLVEWINQRILEETGIDPTHDLQAVQRIVETAEKVKCELSTLPKTLIALPFIVSDPSGPKHFSAEITRAQFNTLIESILERLKPPCHMALEDAKLRPVDLTAVVLVGGSTRIPAVRELVREIFEREPDCSINPDEVVACGASAQGGIMNGEIDEVLLLDVTPLSFGIELAGDLFSPIIPRNSNVPTTVTKRFTTVVDNQTTVNVHVLQGERKIASQNRSLGNFKLIGIPPAPKELPEIEVSFHIDANGILTVSAMDLTSGVSQQVEIESYVPSSSETSHIIEEAESRAESDREFMQKADARRRLQVMEAEFRAIMEQKDAEENLPEQTPQAMKEAIFKWDIAIAGGDWGAIDEAERHAKGVHIEAVSLLAIGRTGAQKKGRAAQNGSGTEPGASHGVSNLDSTTSARRAEVSTQS